MSSAKLVNKKFMSFDEVWVRIIGSTKIKKNKDLAKIVGIAESVVSKRANENKFPVEWGFFVAQEFGLNTDWLLTGEGERKVEQKEILAEIQNWLIESEKANKDFKIWFKIQFESKFPEFKDWKKRKEGRAEDSQDTGFSNVA